MQVLNLDAMDWRIVLLAGKTNVQSRHTEDEHHGSLQDCTDVSWPVTRKGTAQQGEELLHGDALALVLFGFIFFLNVVGSIGFAAIFGQLDVVVATMAGLILGLQICQVVFFTAWIIKEKTPS